MPNKRPAAYYGARIQLDGPAAMAEVALPVTEISSTQRTLGTVLAGSMLAVIVLGSVLGVIFARRISKPLVELSESAARLGQGDLATPGVHAESDVREVVQVGQALEQARLDLAETLTELREEKVWGEHLLESIVEGIMTLDQNRQITFLARAQNGLPVGSARTSCTGLAMMSSNWWRRTPLSASIFLSLGRKARWSSRWRMNAR